MEVEFTGRKLLTANIWEYEFVAKARLDYLPGQYGSLHLASVTNDPRGASRIFSLTSLPDNKNITFIVKHFEKQSQFKQVLQSLEQGQTAKLDSIMGDLVLPKSSLTPLCFVAGGIGIASHIGMIKQLLELDEKRDISLYYQLRSEDERIFDKPLKNYQFSYKKTFVRPKQISARELQKNTPSNTLFYISGSQTFVESLQQQLESDGIPRQQIIFDYYDGYEEL